MNNITIKLLAGVEARMKQGDPAAFCDLAMVAFNAVANNSLETAGLVRDIFAEVARDAIQRREVFAERAVQIIDTIEKMQTAIADHPNGEHFRFVLAAQIDFMRSALHLLHPPSSGLQP